MSKKSTPQKNWREECRMQAWKLHEKGWKQKDIAEALGVTDGAVKKRVQKGEGTGSRSPETQVASRISTEALERTAGAITGLVRTGS
jgi:predicted transcriptional regulator